MSSNGKRVRKPRTLRRQQARGVQPGDEVVGEYSRERLIRMNDRLVERVERAIAAGDESLQGPTGLASAR